MAPHLDDEHALGKLLGPRALPTSRRSMRHLAQRCRELGQRKHPHLPVTVAAAWADERQQLTPITMPFDSYVEPALRVSSTCLVTIDRNRYSVPAQWAGRVVSVRVSAGQIHAVADGAEITCHDRCFGRDQWICEPWHYVPIL